jgi:hypothetical protein
MMSARDLPGKARLDKVIVASRNISNTRKVDTGFKPNFVSIV